VPGSMPLTCGNVPQQPHCQLVRSVRDEAFRGPGLVHISPEMNAIEHANLACRPVGGCDQLVESSLAAYLEAQCMRAAIDQEQGGGTRSASALGSRPGRGPLQCDQSSASASGGSCW
jgi:hypothetical protein